MNVFWVDGERFVWRWKERIISVDLLVLVGKENYG